MKPYSLFVGLSRVLAGISLTLLGAFLINCGGGQKKKEKGLNTPVKFALKCEGGQAIREHRDRKSDELLERGPVQLPQKPKKMECSDAEDLKETEIRAFRRHGIWEQFYKGTDKVLSRGEYKLNKRVGTYKFFNKKGENTRIVDYVKGKKEGREITYFAPTTEWRIKGQNKNGKKTGLWEKKSNRAGDCLERGNYEKGYREGAWIECGTDTKSHKEGGKIVLDKKYFVKFKGSYQNGARSGPGIFYYPGEKVQARGNFSVDGECVKKTLSDTERAEKCGKRSGRWTVYYPNGKTAMEGSYDPQTGYKVGTWTEYYQSGQKLATGKRKHTREGMWTFWDKGGKVVGKYVFKGNDVTIRGGIQYVNGKKFAESLPGEGCRKRKNARGRMVEMCRIPAGGFIGAILKFDQEKDMVIARLSLKQGRWRYYNGGKTEEGECRGGRRAGTWKVNGSPKSYGIMGPRCD